MEYELNNILEAANNSGYGELKAKLGAEEDLPFQELAKNECCLWTTANGDIFFSLEVRKVMTVIARDDNDFLGECCSYDFDEEAFVSCVLSALRDYLNDIDETFVNEDEE